MFGQINNPATQFYQHSKLRDLDKKPENGFTIALPEQPVLCADSSQRLL